MAEAEEVMLVDLRANLAPLLEGMRAGLEQVKARIQAFKGEAGKIELTADVNRLLSQLNEAKARAGVWKRETDAVSVVQPNINPGAFVGGLTTLKAKAEGVARSLGNVFFAFAGFRELTSIVGGLIQASNEQELAAAKLRTALQAAGAAGIQAFEPLVAQANELQKQFGIFGDDELEAAQAVLVRYKLSEEQIRRLIPAIMDASVGLQKAGQEDARLEDVAVLTGKALSGHAEALQRLGIGLDQVTYKADPLKAVLQAYGVFSGQAAAQSDTLAGQMKKLTVYIGELKESLGDMLKDVLAPIVSVLTAVLQGFVALPAPVQRLAVGLGLLMTVMAVTKTSFAGLALNVLAFTETLSASTIPAVLAFARNLATLNFSGAIAGIKGTATALVGMASSLNLVGKAVLVVGAAFVGWQIGRWISDVTGLSDACSVAKKELDGFTDEELRAIGARLESRTGIQMNTEALRVWVSMSLEARNRLVNEAMAAGKLTLSLDDLTAAREADIRAQREMALQARWDLETKSLDEYRKYYRMTRLQQVQEDLWSVEQRIQKETMGTDAFNALVKEKDGLLRQQAAEEVRLAEDAAKKGESAVKKSIDEQKKKIEELFEKAAAVAQQIKDRWKQMAAEIARELLSPRMAEESDVRMEAAERARVAAQVLQGQQLADQLVAIEQSKVAKLQAIDEQYLLDQQTRDKAAADKADSEAQAALTLRQQQYQAELIKMTDPLRAWFMNLDSEMNAHMTAFAGHIVSALQPIEQAFQSFIMGTKVRWDNVLRQMAASFLMIFVRKFLAWLAQTILQWVLGEKIKTAASTAGAAGQAVAAKKANASMHSTAAAAMSSAVAKIFDAHAWIPYVGVALATAFSVQALGVWLALTAAAKAAAAGATAMAIGGRVDEPTFALIGERGPELVAPERDFRDVVAGIVDLTMGTFQRTVASSLSYPAPMPAPAGPGYRVENQVNFHGFAFVDTGNKAFLRQTARAVERARREERDLGFGAGDVPA